jgi:replicative DNA helicase
MENTEHEKYLAGLMLHAIEDHSTGDFRTEEILATADYTKINDLGSKAVFYALETLFSGGLQADIGTIFTLAKGVNATAEMVSEIYGLHYSETSYEWHLSELRSNLAKNTIFKGLKDLSKVFDTNTLEQTKDSLAVLIDEEQFSSDKADCINEIKRELFHTEKKFIPSGSEGLDRVLGGGFEKTQMITLAGRPGMGKTSYALQLAIGRKKLGLPTMVFTMEMSSANMMQRLISQDIGIPMGDVPNAKSLGYETLSLCERSADDIDNNKLELVARPSLTLAEIKSHIRSSIYRAKQEGQKPLDLAVIDYLGLLSLPSGSDLNVLEYTKLTELSRAVKKLAMELDIAILILAQLNRGTEGRESPIPKLSDLRGSGAIEQDSNKVLFVFRPNMYHDDAMERNNPNQEAHVIVAKNREGAVGSASYTFNPKVGIWNEC